jgi:glycerol-1-phosphate dehydrogenase [NAD(P)+]
VDKEFAILATAPSMDGFASSTSSMEMNGLKISLPSKAPDTIIGDLDILAAAPEKMLSSGIGDMLAKYVSICEWRIAHIVKDEYYCEEVASMMRSALKNCVAVADGLLARDIKAVKAVFEGLVLSGVATEYAGLSRPASGAEHYISHIFDMRSVSFGTKADMHGIQCVIATLAVVKLYEKLRNFTPDRARAETFVKSFNYSEHAEKLSEFVGSGAKYMIELEKKEQKYSLFCHKKRFDKIMGNWNEILKIIEEELPSSKQLENILQAFHLPLCFADVGIDNDLVPLAFEFTKDIRDKYVLSHLVWDLGLSSKELFDEK